MAHTLTALARDRLGATAIEYAFLIALVALAIVGAAELLGTQLAGFFGTAASEVQNATP